MQRSCTMQLRRSRQIVQKEKNAYRLVKRAGYILVSQKGCGLVRKLRESQGD